MIPTILSWLGKLFAFAFLFWLFRGLYRIGGTSLGEGLHHD